jgi:glutamate racemase
MSEPEIIVLGHTHYVKVKQSLMASDGEDYELIREKIDLVAKGFERPVKFRFFGYYLPNGF